MISSLKRLWADLGPYRKLAGYLKPYRRVLILGSLCGLGFGVVSGSIPFIINFVGKVVFTSDASGSPDQASLGAMSKPLEFIAINVLHLDEVSKSMIVAVACLLIPVVMLLRSALDFFNEAHAGNLFQRVVNETREVRNVLTIINTQLISQPATWISRMIVLFHLDWRFTLGALILPPCCMVPAISLGKKSEWLPVVNRGKAGT